MTLRPVDDDDKSAFESAVHDIQSILINSGAKRNILAMCWDVGIQTYENEDGEGMVVVCNRMGTRFAPYYRLQFYPDEHPMYSQVQEYLANFPGKDRISVFPEMMFPD